MADNIISTTSSGDSENKTASTSVNCQAMGPKLNFGYLDVILCAGNSGNTAA